MSKEQTTVQLNAPTSQAVAELQDRITQHYPTATFELSHPEDEPTSIELTAIDVSAATSP
jgi:hypothetical protein